MIDLKQHWFGYLIVGVSLLKKYDDEELVSAIDRFENIMKLLSASLKKTSDHTDDDFAKAIEATEIYQTYKKCFN